MLFSLLLLLFFHLNVKCECYFYYFSYFVWTKDPEGKKEDVATIEQNF